jgi:hypothetical protein
VRRGNQGAPSCEQGRWSLAWALARMRAYRSRRSSYAPKIEGQRPRRQKARCAICMKPILEGDGIRRVAPPGITETRPAHTTCFDRDWETILSGLEPFPIRP